MAKRLGHVQIMWNLLTDLVWERISQLGAEASGQHQKDVYCGASMQTWEMKICCLARNVETCSRYVKWKKQVTGECDVLCSSLWKSAHSFIHVENVRCRPTVCWLSAGSGGQSQARPCLLELTAQCGRKIMIKSVHKHHHKLWSAQRRKDTWCFKNVHLHAVVEKACEDTFQNVKGVVTFQVILLVSFSLGCVSVLNFFFQNVMLYNWVN